MEAEKKPIIPMWILLADMSLPTIEFEPPFEPNPISFIDPILQDEIDFVKSVLPSHYEVKESKSKGSIHCKSNIGIRMNGNREDDEHWSFVLNAIKNHFGKRFSEVFHNTCSYHQDFTIYLR